jgi:hypothetical protein
MILRRTCQQMCALLIAREDRKLAAPDRIAMALHLLACKSCPGFERQLLTMRNSLQRWRGYVSGDD